MSQHQPHTPRLLLVAPAGALPGDPPLSLVKAVAGQPTSQPTRHTCGRETSHGTGVPHTERGLAPADYKIASGGSSCAIWGLLPTHSVLRVPQLQNGDNNVATS